MSINQRFEKKLGLSVSQKSLVLQDEIKAQATTLANAKLDELNIALVMGPKNMTHLLQPVGLTTSDAMKTDGNSRLVNNQQIVSHKYY